MTAETKAARDGKPYPEEYRMLCSAGARYHHVKNGFHQKEKGKQMSTVQIISYGGLMTGDSNHRYCRNAVYIQPCTITGTLYDTGWGFPAFVPGETGTVKAELI